jgi:hypothetical protein
MLAGKLHITASVRVWRRLILRFLIAKIALGVTLSAGVAFAQAPTSVRVAGAISKIEGGRLVLQGETGTTNILVNNATRVSGVAPGSMADIKKGAYIGAGAQPQADGSLKAVQVYVFPEAQRGLAEGHRAWDVMPGATMTNAEVAETVGAVDGTNVTLTYKDGQKKLQITPDSSVLVFAQATPASLVPGTLIAVSGTTAADGTLTATRITVGTKGAKPL